MSESAGSTAYPYRRTIFILAVVLALAYVDRQLLVVLIEPVKRDLALSDTQVGLLTGGAFAFFYAVLGVPVARLADRTSRRNVLAGAVLVWSAMTCLCGAAQNMWQLLLARMGVGAGESGCIPPAHSIIAAITPPARLASAMAAYSVGIPAGVLSGMLLGGWLGEWIGWRAALVVVGAPGVLVAVLVRFGLREPPQASAAAGDAAHPAIWAATKQILSQGPLILVLLGSGLISLAVGVLLIWTPSLLARTTDLGIGAIGSWLGVIIGLGGAAGMLLGGVVADRLGRLRGARWRAATAAGAGALAALSAALMLAQGHAVGLLSLLIFPILFGMAPTGVTNAVIQSLAPQHLRAFTASVLIFVNTVFGIAMGPLLVGIVSDALSATGEALALKLALLGVVPGCFLLGSICHLLAACRIVETPSMPVAASGSQA